MEADLSKSPKRFNVEYRVCPPIESIGEADSMADRTHRITFCSRLIFLDDKATVEKNPELFFDENKRFIIEFAFISFSSKRSFKKYLKKKNFKILYASEMMNLLNSLELYEKLLVDYNKFSEIFLTIPNVDDNEINTGNFVVLDQNFPDCDEILEKLIQTFRETEMSDKSNSKM
jgi:hypothetical protein